MCQFRLPFIGGVVALDQGFNPLYTDGEYNINDTTMIVSRGLGNSIIPVRLFNYPEIVHCWNLGREITILIRRGKSFLARLSKCVWMLPMRKHIGSFSMERLWAEQFCISSSGKSK